MKKYLTLELTVKWKKWTKTLNNVASIEQLDTFSLFLKDIRKLAKNKSIIIKKYITDRSSMIFKFAERKEDAFDNFILDLKVLITMWKKILLENNIATLTVKLER